MNFIGIMQGRLLPPVGDRIQSFPGARWVDEFPLARAAGFDSIEWVYDHRNCSANPLNEPDGIKRILSLSQQNGIRVRSLCADYFIEKPLVHVLREDREEAIRHLEGLTVRCAEGGIGRIVLPFVDQSAIRDTSGRKEAADVLARVSETARRLAVEIHLETSLGPQDFVSLLEEIPWEGVKVNYDTGNSASLGYEASEEFSAYGHRVGSVHIKDRRRHGATVPLGSGDTDFETVFRKLEALNYQGDFVLQVARGEPGKELEWAWQNLDFLKRSWQGVGRGIGADR